MNAVATDVKVLVVNDDPTQLSTLSNLVRKAGFAPMPCSTVEEALDAMISSTPPALIITDVVMPGIDGWRFCRLLRSEEYAPFNKVPILVVSAVFSGEQPERIAADLGAEDFLAAPVDGAEFIDRVRSVVRGKDSVPTPPQRVLLVDDEIKTLEFLSAFFLEEGYEVHTAPNLKEGLQQAAAQPFDVAILDFRLPDGSGDALIEPVLSRNPDCACIIITGDLDPKRSLDWMKMGAAAYVSKPFEPGYLLELCARVRRERLLLQMPKILERRTGDLLTSEQRLRQVLDSVPSVAVRGYQPDGTVLYWNQAARTLYGYSAEEAVGANLFDLIVPKASAASIREELATLAISATPPPHAEIQLRHKDGSPVPVLSSYAMVSTQSGELELFSFDVDLTERKQVEAELRQAQKMDSIGRLAGGVAHDFNNMLGVILGHTEMALEGLAEDHSLCPDLREIQKAARHSADLTRQLLAFARKQTMNPRVMELNQAVDATLSMLRRLIGEHIELKWHPSSKATPICADPIQIDQILANLCVNARDAIGTTGGTIEISSGVRSLGKNRLSEAKEIQPGTFIYLEIKDNGCGMSKETLSHLFEPFFTTKRTGEGTGLGLSTVYGIVRQNHGLIEVDSEPEQGTTFTIYFPRHAQSESSATATTATTSAEDAEQSGGTILLVEDEPAMLRIVKSLLMRQKYEVLAASSATEAIELAAQHTGHIDLLLTDVVMPGMNGKQLADELQKQHPELRCLFMSGYSTDVIARHGVIDHKVHFIQKPFNLKGLSAAILAAMAGDAP